MKKLFVLIAIYLTLAGCSKFQSPNLSTEPISVAAIQLKPDIESDHGTKIPSDMQLETEKIQTGKIEKPLVTSAKLVAIGDILLHQSVYKDAATDQGTYNFFPMFEQVKPFIESADIAIANQETMIGGKELGLSSYPIFNSPYEIGDALKDTGIDIVTLANNHTMDKGEKGILNAVSHWNQIGMLYTGAFKSQEDRETIRTITKNGITFSFLSYTYGTNGLSVPQDKPYLVNLIDLTLIKKDVERAKQLSDVVVVSMHWGNEYEETPNQTQIDLAHSLSEMGTDIIIGHHPHVLQPIDLIERSDGSRTFVLYSLGNFLSAQEGVERLTGGIGGIEVTKVTYQGKTTIKLSDPSFVPTYGYYENWRNFEVIPMHQLNDTYLPNYQVHYVETQNHMKQFIKELTFTDRLNN
ncbi:CapA family protein [Paenisporosarcina indica]|uniref:CapA family protein n=1 Tax=Paenisporosarcina indica TaxID=650093 RepID=UPI00094FBACF|nr:CapA family protein [Paenisporosarcina indica]